MIVAAVRQIADWLADGTTGVNALLSAVPRDSGEAAPSAVTIYDSTRTEWVTRGTVPRALTGSGALLLVKGPERTAVPLFGGYSDCDVWVAYVRRAATSVASDDALRDALQTLRTAARSIALQYDTPEANPIRNQVAIDRPTCELLEQSEPLAGDDLVLASLVFTLPVSDRWTTGA